MENLTRIQANNAELQECIDKANALPDAAGGGSIDTSGVTATAEEVLAGEKFIGADGKLTEGTMPQVEDSAIVLNPSKVHYQIPKGYHSGNGIVIAEVDQLAVTPTKSSQSFGDANGSFIGMVTVAPIPDEYIIPSGTKEITDNGTHDVTGFASVNVDVPPPDGFVEVSGTRDITENGIYVVEQYQFVNVNVESGSSVPEYQNLYQRVEYITSAEEGTYPYIITDIYADNNTGVEVVAAFPVLQDRIPMGSRNDSNATRFYCAYPLSSSSCYYGFNSGVSLSGTFAINTKYRCQTNFLCSRMAGIFKANGDRASSGIISSTLTAQTATISIFGYHSASSGAVTSKREYKLYGARISQGFEVIRDYIPCCRKSDGLVGLYEKFTGTFLTAETGAFTKGADVDW